MSTFFGKLTTLIDNPIDRRLYGKIPDYSIRGNLSVFLESVYAYTDSIGLTVSNLTKACRQGKEKLLVKVPRKRCNEKLHKLTAQAFRVDCIDALSTEKDDGELIKKLSSPCNRTLPSEHLSTPSLKRIRYYRLYRPV